MSRRGWLPITAIAAAVAVLGTLPAHAVRFRRPFNVSAGVNYGFDHNGGGGCTDFACGGVCYDGHSGTDFPLSLGTTVVAPADGRVGATYNGCANYGGLGSTCGGRCGNYVRIDYADGTSTLYCHMELNSIVVGTGDWVSCGQALGHSASSGNSSGPHLHFGFKIGGVNRDPFAGGCSQSTSYWMDQGGYPHNMPSTACEVTCECSPGDSQQGGCGNCGTHSRSCGSDCRWGGWSSCDGQGECAAGQTDARACCDCGTQSRQCSGQCSWGDWSACGGPDPNGGQDVCDTGEPGICSEGRMRCVEGCEACVREHEPEPERCDELDNDCNALEDDGFPQVMGDPAPEFAARLVDQSSPQALAPGESATAWAAFLNEGRSPWRSGELWLVPAATREGHKSELFDSLTWPAFDIAAVLLEDVEPGQSATFVWQIRTSDDFSGTVEERFQLSTADGTLLRCPSPNMDVVIRASLRAKEQPDTTPAAQPSQAAAEGDSGTMSACACGVVSSRSRGASLWALLLLAGLGRSRRIRALGKRRPT